MLLNEEFDVVVFWLPGPLGRRWLCRRAFAVIPLSEPQVLVLQGVEKDGFQFGEGVVTNFTQSPRNCGSTRKNRPCSRTSEKVGSTLRRSRCRKYFITCCRSTWRVNQMPCS